MLAVRCSSWTKVRLKDLQRLHGLQINTTGMDEGKATFCAAGSDASDCLESAGSHVSVVLAIGKLTS